MKRLLALTAVYLTSYSSFAYATNAGTSYFELAVSSNENSEKVENIEINNRISMADLFLGYQFSDYLSLEGHLGFGLNDDRNTIDGIEIITSVEKILGANLKTSIPIYNTIMLTAKAGLYKADVNEKITAYDMSMTETLNGATYSAGVEYYLDYSSYLGLSYQSYKGDLDASAVTLTFGTRF